MIIILSPAKKLNMEIDYEFPFFSQCEFLDDSAILIDKLKDISMPEIASLMDVSESIATLNKERFNSWALPFSLDNSSCSGFAFAGDTYQGLNIRSWSIDNIKLAQDRVCILSGLYGILRPLDLLQAYRLEMGTLLHGTWGNSLYDFWGDKLSLSLDKRANEFGYEYIINCASQEYSKAVISSMLKTKVINIIFHEIKGNSPGKVISFSAKRARGMLAKFIIQNSLEKLEHLKDFNLGGYTFNSLKSDKNNLLFERKVS